MSEKIRIRVGSLELEWESDESLSLENVKSLLREIETLSPVCSEQPRTSGSAGAKMGESNGGAKMVGSQRLFVTSIAAKLGAKTGADLARAAAAHLQLTDGKESFTRSELLETMKKAPMYFKAAMRGNLSGIISSLIPDTLNQISENTYSLTATAYAALETAIA